MATSTEFVMQMHLTIMYHSILISEWIKDLKEFVGERERKRQQL